MIERKEQFTDFYARTHSEIARWLNSLIGQQLSQGKVIRIIDWHIVPGYLLGEYVAIARVEVEDV